jgi:dipeptidase D
LTAVGEKLNAIMPECKALISVEDVNVATKEINKLIGQIKDELRVTDAGFTCDVKIEEAPEKMLTDEMSKSLIAYILAMPAKERDLSYEIKDAVINSNNLSAVKLSEDEIFVWTFNRSNDDSRQVAMGEELKSLGESFGFTVKEGANFASWKYNPDSKLRGIYKKLVKEKFGVDVKELSAHGGLETGVFYGKDPELDIITFGPKADGAHTPDEHLDLASFKETFEFLLELLEELTK